MNSARLLLILVATLVAVTFSALARAQDLSNDDINHHFDDLLASRVGLLLEARLSKADRCSDKIEVKKWQKRYQEWLARKTSAASPANTLQALSLYGESQKSSCALPFKEGETKLDRDERSPFLHFRNALEVFCLASPLAPTPCLSFVDQVAFDIDPTCPTVVTTKIDGSREEGGCFGAAPLLAKNLLGRDSENLSKLISFISDLRVLADYTLTQPNLPRQIDLWSTFKLHFADTPENRELLVSLVSMLNSAAAGRGLIDSTDEIIWKKILETSHSAETTRDVFDRLQWSDGKFQSTLQDWQYAGFHLSIGAHNIDSADFHDYMGAFLGCHYRDESVALRKYLPRILGYFYKSIGFLHHEKEGWSFGRSFKNWKDDSYRFKDGAQWGYEFCSGKPHPV